MRELTQRQEIILAAVTDGYLTTGEPVGSKAVMELMDHACSSATIRNEMAEMERRGYLEQPHTSAGRVPTAAGLRYYVDYLMEVKPLTERERRRIDDRVVPYGPDPAALARKAGEVLSALTGCACVIVSPTMEEAVVERIDLFYIRRGIWGIAVTTSGGIHSAVCHLNLDRESGDHLSRILSKIFKGVRLRQITPAFLEGSLLHLGPYAFRCFGLLDTIYHLAASLRDSKVTVDGQTVLMKNDDTQQVHRLLELLHSTQRLKNLFPASEGITVVLGDELSRSNLAGIGAIYTGYHQGNDLMGSIGIVGPVRMDYRKAAANVSYISRLLGHVLEKE